jgi:hypothetical protein
MVLGTDPHLIPYATRKILQMMPNVSSRNHNLLLYLYAAENTSVNDDITSPINVIIPEKKTTSKHYSRIALNEPENKLPLYTRWLLGHIITK